MSWQKVVTATHFYSPFASQLALNQGGRTTHLDGALGPPTGHGGEQQRANEYVA